MNSYDANHVWSKGVLLRRISPTDSVVEEDVEIFGVQIPAGYKTDGASVPRVFYNILSRYGIGLLAALVHDARYDPPADAHGLKWRVLTRKEADKEFYDNLVGSGVSKRRAYLCWTAVRAAGWKYWNAGKKKHNIKDVGALV